MRRVMLVGPVVLGLSALSACGGGSFNNSSSVPLSSIAAATETPSSVMTAPTPTPSATSSVPQQTGEANPSPFVSTAPPDANAPKPVCATVWVDRSVLPTTYHGCTGDAKADEQHLDCNSGPQLWIRNEPDGSEFWAFAGKLISHSRTANADAAATGTCMS